MQIAGFILQSLKLIGKVLLFFGFAWFLIPIGLAELVMRITGIPFFSGELNPVLFFLINDVAFYMACVLAVLTTIQNIIRTVNKDRTFSIYRWIFAFGKKREKGTVAKVDNIHIASHRHKEVSGFVFGKDKDNGKYITKSEETDGHILVIGGAGFGKTSGIAIPTLKSWKGRAFVIDIKGELYEKTSHNRGQDKIRVFNPTDRYACNYDPYYILRHSDDISADARELALSICPLPPDTKEPFWIKSAQNMLTGFILYFCQQGNDFSTTMRNIKLRPVSELVDEIMDSSCDKARLEVSQFKDMDGKTLSGVFAEVSNHITVFATNDDLQRALSYSGTAITPNDLENGFDVYCCIPEHKLEQWKDLLSMMCNQFLKSFERRSEQCQTPILCLIDEFARLGKIESITNGLATLRSKKIHITLFVQSKSQLNVNYGKDVAEVIADNCSYKAILNASEPTTQEWCSKLVGTYDKTKKSNSYNADMLGIGKGQGTSTTTEEKPIIKPADFAYLDDIVCLFPNGYRRIQKIKYWEDKAFS